MALHFLAAVTKDEESAVSFLQEKGVLRTNPNCADCGKLMTLIKCGREQKNGYDLKMFRCPAHKCFKMSPKKDTFWENTSLTYQQIVQMIFVWAFKMPNTTAAELVGVSEATVSNWFTSLRKLCSHWLCNQSEAETCPAKSKKSKLNNAVSKEAGDSADSAEEVVVKKEVCDGADSTAESLAPVVEKSTLELRRDELKWRSIYGNTGVQALSNMLEHISLWYPVP